MKHGPLIFLGVFFTLALSWYGMVAVPQTQVGDALQVTAGPAGVRYPSGRAGLAQQGLEVYRANGCYYCHTQQVRPGELGADIERGWGTRFSVAQDYLAEDPVMLGQRRIGPDLSNMGTRLPVLFVSPTTVAPGTNDVVALREWHLKHLYNPRITSPGSNMPQYPYLFEHVERRKGTPAPANALDVPPEFAPKPDSDEIVIDVVPKHEAEVLVDYLLSLQAEVPLFEAPIPAEPEGETNQVPDTVQGTNVVAPAQAAPGGPNP